MAKTFKRLYPRITSFENLLEAAHRAQKGRRYRDSTLAFNARLEENLHMLRMELLDGSYQPGEYRDFFIEDSKKRLISAAPYRDRVVHHAVMAVIEPLFDRSFIFDTYACRKGKGSHAALLRFRHFLAGHRYVLKCDIRKYFQSMDHEILLAKLERRIACPPTMELLRRIVGSRDFNAQNPPAYFPGDDLFAPLVRRRGIPVGNLTSQFFANLFLNDFDHWLTEELRAGPYVRYVDDFCVFGNDKGALNAVREEIARRLGELRLLMHEGKSRIYTHREGIEFLGFRHLPGQVRVRRENVLRFKRRMRDLQSEYRLGRVTDERVRASVVSWIAHAAWADSRGLRRTLIPTFAFVRASNHSSSSSFASAR